MAELPRPGDSHGNLLWKIVINTFEGGGGGGGVGPAGPAGPQGPPGDPAPGIQSLADATAIWLTAAEDVGVGIDLPLAKLHVQVGDTTAVPSAAANTFVVEGTAANMGMTLLASSGNNAFYAFGNEFASAVAYVGYNMATNQMWLATNNAIRMSIDSTGQVGIGTLAPDGTLHIFSGSAGVVTAATAASQLVIEHSTHAGLSILTPNNVNGHIVFGDPDNPVIGQIVYTHSADTFTFVAGTVNVLQVSATQVRPGTDNAISLGIAGARWTEVFATNGTINTSDAREKHSIEDINGAFARRLVDNITPRSYVWNREDAVGTHYGFIAQEIEEVIRAEGLHANEFAPLHYDYANDRYGLREAQLLPFLWRVVQDLSKRVAAMET